MSKLLPPGLDPITAGRLGLWLLGKRSHSRAALRTVSASRVPGVGLAQRFVDLLAPWTVNEYPGRERILPYFCGVTRETARDWLYRQDHIPPRHARVLAGIAHTRAEQYADLARALEKHAAEREAHNRRPRGIIQQQRARREVV